MDRLFQSAQRGDVEELHTLLQEQPLLLHQISIACTDNPLHFSCAFGHLDFTKVVLQLKPQFVGELNSEGYSPLHLACANGMISIVKEIIKVDPSICRLQGRDGNTPFHVAVLRGKVDVICEMLDECQGCLDDLTFQRETALHLAVKNLHFGSFRVMLDWTQRNNLVEILNRKDEHGNTVFHLAIWKRQRQVLDLLLENGSGTLEVNAINNSNLTALDLLLIFPSEAGDREILEILQRAGALKAQNLPLQITTNSCSTRNAPVTNTSSYNLIQYFKFHAGRDSPSDVRSTLLVIAVLAATATYQLGISPPGGTWQDDHGHVAGTSILASHKLVTYALLVACNSLGLNISLYMIAILTSKFPLAIDLQLLLFCLYFSYNLTLGATSPKNAQVYTVVVTSILPTVVPLIGNLFRKYDVYRCVLGLFRRGH